MSSPTTGAVMVATAWTLAAATFNLRAMAREVARPLRRCASNSTPQQCHALTAEMYASGHATAAGYKILAGLVVASVLVAAFSSRLGHTTTTRQLVWTALASARQQQATRGDGRLGASTRDGWRFPNRKLGFVATARRCSRFRCGAAARWCGQSCFLDDDHQS